MKYWFWKFFPPEKYDDTDLAEFNAKLDKARKDWWSADIDIDTHEQIKAKQNIYNHYLDQAYRAKKKHRIYEEYLASR